MRKRSDKQSKNLFSCFSSLCKSLKKEEWHFGWSWGEYKPGFTNRQHYWASSKTIIPVRGSQPNSNVSCPGFFFFLVFAVSAVLVNLFLQEMWEKPRNGWRGSLWAGSGGTCKPTDTQNRANVLLALEHRSKLQPSLCFESAGESLADIQNCHQVSK